jgi:two-component system chemotaxis response regulator CheY
LDKIAQSDFDLILSDYRMPALDGRQFYQRVSQLKPHLVPRIVFLTGDVANEDTQDFLASIQNACITKPFQLQTVETAINGALHSSQRLSRLAGAHHQN